MGAPPGGIHHRTRAGEVLSQGDGLGRAHGGDDGGHAAPAHLPGRPVDRRRPAEACQTHHQGHQHQAEHQLATIGPLAREQAEHEQRQAEQGRKNTEETERLDLQCHHPHQHQAEHRHAGADQQQSPATEGGQARARLAPEHQRQQRQQQHRQVGQKAEQGQGLTQHGAPGTAEHLVAAVSAPGAGEGAQHTPALEGDRPGIDGTDGGQHRHHHPQPTAP